MSAGLHGTGGADDNFTNDFVCYLLLARPRVCRRRRLTQQQRNHRGVELILEMGHAIRDWGPCEWLNALCLSCSKRHAQDTGLLVKVITPLAAAVAAAASEAVHAALFNNTKGCIRTQVICLQALFESAASTENFSSVADF